MSFELVKIRDFVGHTQAVYCFDYNFDSERLFSASADGFVVEWRLNEPDGKALLKHKSAIFCVKSYFNFVIAGSRDGELLIYDFKNNEFIKSIQLTNKGIFDIVFFKSHYWVATESGELLKLNLNFECLKAYKFSHKSIRQIVVANDELVLACSDGRVLFLDENIEIKLENLNHDGTVFCLTFNSENNQIISGGKDAILVVQWQNLLVKKINAHLLHIHGVNYQSETGLLASCSMDKTIKIWRCKDMELLKVIHTDKGMGHQSSVNKILWIDKNTLISCSDDRTLQCYQIKEK